MKTALVLGASGATGKLLVQSLLHKGVEVIAMVRNPSSLAHIDDPHKQLHIVEANISEISEAELSLYLKPCDAVLSCLGHTLSFKGMFGQPRRLVTDAVVKVANTIATMNDDKVFQFVLMNTSANSNRDIPEQPPLSQRLVVALLCYLLPPQADNEQAADVLRHQIGQHHKHIDWVAVRPDGLVNEDQVSEYDIHASPIRNVIFDAGQTSRINVADFMASLVVEPKLWQAWQGNMPVIYNRR